MTISRFTRWNLVLAFAGLTSYLVFEHRFTFGLAAALVAVWGLKVPIHKHGWASAIIILLVAICAKAGFEGWNVPLVVLAALFLVALVSLLSREHLRQLREETKDAWQDIRAWFNHYPDPDS